MNDLSVEFHKTTPYGPQPTGMWSSAFELGALPPPGGAIRLHGNDWFVVGVNINYDTCHAEVLLAPPESAGPAMAPRIVPMAAEGQEQT